MTRSRPGHCTPPIAALAAVLIAFTLFAVSAPAVAQNVPAEVENLSDQFDVPFVPSHENVLKAMFDMAKPTKDDYVVDLGSGDGRIVITAAKEYGAQGFGVDLNDKLVAIANERARDAGVGDRAKFYVRDLFKTDISKATIVTMYLLPEVVMEIRPKLFSTLRPGTRIVSHDYHLGDWRPENARVVPIGLGEESIVYHWIVPAKVAGWWRWEISYPGYFEQPLQYEARLKQKFQDVEGDILLNGGAISIHDATLRSDRIAFSATGELDDRIVRHDFSGTVRGKEIVGTVRLSGGVREVELPWRARLTLAGVR